MPQLYGTSTYIKRQELDRMDKRKERRVSEDERIKQRNLSWRERRRIIERVLFVVLTIVAILIVTYAVWIYTVE